MNGKAGHAEAMKTMKRKSSGSYQIQTCSSASKPVKISSFFSTLPASLRDRGRERGHDDTRVERGDEKS